MKDSSAYAMPVNQSLILHVKPISVDRIHDCVQGTAKFFAAAGVGGFVAWLSAWGTTTLLDQLYAVLQRSGAMTMPAHGVFLAMAMWFFFVPFTACFTFGCLRGMLKGSAFWYIAPLAGVLLLGAGDFLLEGAWQDVLELSPWLLFAAATGYAAMLLGQRVQIRKR